MPSTVSTVRPSAITPRTVQLFTGVPSSRTTHAPQLEVSQPQWVPVRPNWSRSRWTRSTLGSTSAVRVSPFTVTETFVISGLLSTCPGHRTSQGPFGELAGEVTLVVGRAALVGGGAAVRRGEVAGGVDRVVGHGGAAQRV